MQRLGKNHGGYRGEGIELQSVLDELKIVAVQNGWRKDFFSLSPGNELLAFYRAAKSPRKKIYLSAGIHGDEPAGPLAALELLRADEWPDDIDFWLCPCLNLTGFPLNRRENAQGIDLNRDYRHLLTDEVRTHVAWLERQPNFDVALCLHEDWEANGFYLYELNPDNRASFAGEIISNVSKICPIENGETVDGWPIKNGVIQPNIDPKDRPQWPEALFLITTKTRQSYTLETPSDFPLATRVAAQIAAVRSVLNSI